MNIFQNLRLALLTIGRNKLRSTLTMLGMIIGIAAVVTVFSIGDGLKAQVQQEVEALGVDLITISPQPEGKPLTFSDYEMVNSNNDVSAAAPVTYLGATVQNGEVKADQAVVSATLPSLSNILAQNVQFGRFFNDEEKNVIVLGADVAQQLFGDDNPIDQEVTLKQETEDPETFETKVLEKEYKVVGAYGQVGAPNSIGPGALLDTTAYIPFESGKFFTNNATFVDEINARAVSDDQLGQVKASLIETLKNNRGGAEDFSVQTSEDISESFADIFNVVTNFIAAIAAISLLVGGIGIMNIMLTSVTERTREIGIRKAIGASRTVIMFQFLTEALVLTVFGGLLGIGAAYLLSFLVKNLADISPVFTLQAFLIAVGVSILIGVVFGTFPAIQAARKRPIEALRHE